MANMQEVVESVSYFYTNRSSFQKKKKKIRLPLYIGKDKVPKVEVWAPHFISCDRISSPTAPTAIRLWETFILLRLWTLSSLNFV